MGWIPGWESVSAAGWWSGFFFWASIVSLIGLGISEVASHRYGERKDELVAIEQDAKDKRHDEDMTRVQHDAALAIERAAVLEKEAAKANEEAAKARAEQERLKSLVVWRSIEPDKRTPMVAMLATRKETIKLLVVMNDPEAFVFASQLTAIFNAAHWEAVAEAGTWGNLLPQNVLLPGPDNETVKLLRAAFTMAGVKFGTDSIRPPDASIVFESKPTSATVIVGSKLGPLE